MDLLLTHGYFLFEDPHELEVMRPYPPLGLLYISSHLKAAGFDVEVFDATFSSEPAFRSLLEVRRPPVVGFYANMMTRRRIIPMIAHCRTLGSRVIVGGPDAANYPDNYLDHGADVVVIGEGERTVEALLPRLSAAGPLDLEGVAGVVWRPAGTETRHEAPRPYIEDLDAQPFPDRGAIDLERYVQVWRDHHGMGAVSLITARGCQIGRAHV